MKRLIAILSCAIIAFALAFTVSCGKTGGDASSGAAAGGDIKFAVCGPMTGSGAAFGEMIKMGARLKAEVTPRAVRAGDDPAICFDDRRLGASGWDAVEFLIATNPGEPPRPLVDMGEHKVRGRNKQVRVYTFAGLPGAGAD